MLFESNITVSLTKGEDECGFIKTNFPRQEPHSRAQVLISSVEIECNSLPCCPLLSLLTGVPSSLWEWVSFPSVSSLHLQFQYFSIGADWVEKDRPQCRVEGAGDGWWC